MRFRNWKSWKKLKQLKLFNLQIPRVNIITIFKHMTNTVLGGISKVTVVVLDSYVWDEESWAEMAARFLKV